MKRLWPILLILVFLNCRVDGMRGVPNPVQTTIEVRFYNYNWASATLYMIQGGHSRKAGDATTMSHSIRRVRLSRSGFSIRFFVRFLAGFETWLSPELSWAHPGSCVMVRAETYLAHSTVYPCPGR